MMAFLGALLSGLWGALSNVLLGWLKEKDDVERGEITQSVADQSAAVAVAEKASSAGDDALRSVDTPRGLRDYEAADPNNRDNRS